MSAPIAILGMGRMGRGIAIAFARWGTHSVLVDVKDRTSDAYETLRQDAATEIAATFRSLKAAGDPRATDEAATLNHIAYASREQMAEALQGAEVVFEAVTETRDIKRETFAAVADLLPPSAIIASTSSTFPAGEIAALVATPNRCLNAHWLNPAYLIPLVELSAHDGTDPDAIDRLDALLAAHGKVPIRCAPVAGYIIPRLQTLVMNEAARMVEQGIASPTDIDKAIRFGFGVRYANMGVVEFIDFGGVDILHYASGLLSGTLGNAYASPDIVARHMADGKLGAKSGHGFYDWAQVDIDAYRQALLARLIAQTELSLKTEQDARPPSLY